MNPNTNDERIKCRRCKVFHPTINFNKKRNGDFLKACIRCTEMEKKVREKNKCEHGRQKANCKECGGINIC